jgi:hypothetical protein
MRLKFSLARALSRMSCARSLARARVRAQAHVSTAASAAAAAAPTIAARPAAAAPDAMGAVAFGGLDAFDGSVLGTGPVSGLGAADGGGDAIASQVAVIEEAEFDCMCVAAAQTAFVNACWLQFLLHMLSEQKRITPPFAESQPATYEPEGELAWHTPAPTLMAVGAGPVQPADGKSAAADARRGKSGVSRSARRVAMQRNPKCTHQS